MKIVEMMQIIEVVKMIELVKMVKMEKMMKMALVWCDRVQSHTSHNLPQSSSS